MPYHGPKIVWEKHICKDVVKQIGDTVGVSDATRSAQTLKYILFSYAQVAFLDCDPGQSEFSPSGMVALTVVSEPLFGT